MVLVFQKEKSISGIDQLGSFYQIKQTNKQTNKEQFIYRFN